nr:hypothetical protein Iba_chr08cCG5170 [Ipomoea batatas]
MASAKNIVFGMMMMVVLVTTAQAVYPWPCCTPPTVWCCEENLKNGDGIPIRGNRPFSHGVTKPAAVQNETVSTMRTDLLNKRMDFHILRDFIYKEYNIDGGIRLESEVLELRHSLNGGPDICAVATGYSFGV